MGCDIHAYIEYDEQFDNGNINTLNFGHLYLDWGYVLFTLIAGVRYDPLTANCKPLFAPRGLPKLVSHEVLDEYTLRVIGYPDGTSRSGYIYRADASRLVSQNYAEWFDQEHKYMVDPNWHSASWLNATELEQVKSAYELIPFYEDAWTQYKPPEQQPVPSNSSVKVLPGRHGVEYHVAVGEPKPYPAPASLNAVIAALKALGDNARLVFWFDN